MAVGALRKLVQKAMKDAGTKVPKVGDVSKEITKAKKKAQTIEKKRIKKQADEGYKSSTKQTKEEKNLLAKVKRLEKKKAEINKQKKAISDKDKAKKDLAAKNKKTGAKGQSQTQKGVKFKKKYDIQEGMGLDAETGGSRRAAQDVDQGKAGKVTATPGKNFVQSQITKARVSEAKQKVSLQGKVDRGTATASEKAKLKKLKKADTEATGRQQRGQRGKVKLEKGDYVNTKTGEIVSDPKSLADLPGGRDLYVKDPTPPRLEAIKRNARARGMTGRERTLEGLKSGELKSLTKLQRSPKKETTNIGKRGGTGRNRENLAQGGLKMPTADQTGLRKLPTQVRNKMGYMYGGGMAKKPRMSKMDYRKGGMVMLVLDMMKKKKGKK
jgi:hypothetical protein|tara:strand:- start:45 stop:1193 length:1149 start_codon:yes stop_codon:yes gene_type:complete